MNQKQLNNELYNRMLEEQRGFIRDLMTTTPREILDKAYEYTIREDIVCVMESIDLSAKQCEALLKLETPIADVFKAFRDRETDHMDIVRDTLECHANAILRDEFKKALEAR